MFKYIKYKNTKITFLTIRTQCMKPIFLIQFHRCYYGIYLTNINIKHSQAGTY